MKLVKNSFFFRSCLAICLLLSVSLITKAQEGPKKLSANVVLGVPATFFSIKSKPVGIYTASVRYSFNKSWSLEGKLTSNTFYNNATGNAKKTNLDGTASDVLSYRTPVYGLNAVVYYNLHNIFGLNKRPESKFLPYLSLGAGYNMYKPWVIYTTGASSRSSSFGKPYRDFQVGIGTRYYVNANIDLMGGAEYHISETYYLDGFKEKSNPGLDQYLNIYAGVSIKLGSKPWNNLIDWSHKNIENPNENPKVYSKWAIDGTIGLPILFTPVGYNFTGMFGLGLRHSFNRAIGLQFNYSYGKVAGNQDISGTPKRGTPESIKDFSTSLSQMTLRAYFNVLNLTSEPNARKDWNHYAILGAGYTSAKGDASFADGSSKKGVALSNSPGIQTIIIGYEARKYLKHNFDLIGGIDFSYNQSKYIDQAYATANLDNHIYIHTGVTYKIGTSKDKEHIDWSYQNYNNFKDKKTTIEQVPVIEKPVTEEPKIDTSKMVVAPVEPIAPAAPVVVEPVPAPKPEPVVVAPVVTPEPTPAPKPTVTPTPTPKPTPAPKPVVAPAPKPSEYVATDDVTPPLAKYNVIVACYSVGKLSVAKANQAKLSKKGFEPSIYRTSTGSKMLRMSIISTDDRNEALQNLRRARKEIDPNSWIYIYNKQ